MISWSDSKCQATETQDDAVQDASYRSSVRQLSDVVCTDDNDRLIGTCDESMLSKEDETLRNITVTSTTLNNTMLLEDPFSSSHDQDSAEKIKEFQFHVDMVKSIAKPGCSPEMLNVALSLLSSLVKTLDVISSKQYMHASL